MRTPCRHPLVAAMAVIAVTGIVALLSGCSLKKNTAATRHYMAFITRYNVYYNVTSTTNTPSTSKRHHIRMTCHVRSISRP